MHNQSRIAARLRAAGSVFAEDEADLLLAEAKSDGTLESMIQQRVDGLPLEQIVGWAEFCGLRIKVVPGVFIPRPRSEFMVREAIKITHHGDSVVDLCCGSGALGLALIAAVPEIKLYATDIEPAAVVCARLNLDSTNGQVFMGDLFDGLPTLIKGKVDLIMANAPYVPTESIEFMPQEARLYEPLVTLDGGVDGHAVQRRVAGTAVDWLAPGGQLIMETSQRQARATVAILEHSGFVVDAKYDPETDATLAIARKL